MLAACAPAVLASSLSDSDLSPAADTSSGYTQTANTGFENVESDGGTMYIGWARIPKSDGTGFTTVRFIYSSGINLNEKSLERINDMLAAFDIKVEGSMVYDSQVSRSDLVSDSTLVTETSERKAVFACGSEKQPNVLKAQPPHVLEGEPDADSMINSFEYLKRGCVYSVSEYVSLRDAQSKVKKVTLSEDGKTAYTSVVMSEDYVEKTINGKKIRILMINSELKYCFRAPKLVFVRDDTYNVASASDITYLGGSTTAPTSATQPDEPTSSSDDEKIVSSDEKTTQPDDSSDVNIWDYLTTTEADVTSDTTPEEDTTTAPTTASTTTTATSTESTTKATTKATTTQSTTKATTAITDDDEEKIVTTSPTLPTPTTRDTENSTIIPNVTHGVSPGSGRAIVNTRRLALNVRSGPGMKYMVVTVLPKGSNVTVLDTSNPDWYVVRTMGNVVGYCYSEYIKFI